MNTIITNICLSIIILTLLSCNARGNSLDRSPSETFTVEGIDIRQNPLGAIQQALELGKNVDNILDADEELEPISFRELIEYLPEAPHGWTAEKPEGETNSFGSFSVSQVNQTYTQDNKEIKVNIFDCAFNSALYTPFLLSTEFSRESTEGYNKGIKIGNIPGREEYTYSSKQGSLNLLVNNRFLIQIDGRNIEEVELRRWWERMDRSSLTKTSNR